MNEDPTQNLPQSFEERVLAELSAIRQEQAAQREMLHQQGEELHRQGEELRRQGETIQHLHARMNSLDVRLNALEEKVDARLRETRPIWEGVLERLTKIESELNSLNRQLRSIIADLFQVRVRVEKLEDNQPTV